MKILLISPLVLPVTPEPRYTGIEKLVYQYAVEFAKENEVTVVCNADSIFPENIHTLEYGIIGDPYIETEARAYLDYHRFIRDFDIIHDFSHAHLVGRYNPGLPLLALFWHSPQLAHYPKSPYNIIALSKWAVGEFRRVYNQEAKYQQSIIIDTDIYKPNGVRGDRFLTLGVMTQQKGNLLVSILCKELGLPLDVVGAKGDVEYENTVKSMCDGTQIVFHGEVSDKEKVRLMQTCKGLIYIMPEGYDEVTSHKTQEAMLCGAPVIITATSALLEIITQGIDGFLCINEREFRDAILNVDKLKPEQTLEANRKKYSVKEVCGQYMELYKLVAGGMRW